MVHTGTSMTGRMDMALRRWEILCERRAGGGELAARMMWDCYHFIGYGKNLKLLVSTGCGRVSNAESKNKNAV